MSESTRFLSRLLGLYCLIAALCMCLHREAIVRMVTALLQDAPLMFMVGLFTVVAGLALILTHNVWSGGSHAVLVTLIGWVTLIKGLVFWLLPADATMTLFLDRLQYARLFYLYMGLSALIGLYLTWGGFAGRQRSTAA